MFRSFATLLAVMLTAGATSHAQAQGLAVLPSRICQAPHAETFDTSRATDGAERWATAFQAVMERCQKGDVLLLTRDAPANVLRYCDFDRPVQFLPTGNAICTFAGGVRERR